MGRKLTRQHKMLQKQQKRGKETTHTTTSIKPKPCRKGPSAYMKQGTQRKMSYQSLL